MILGRALAGAMAGLCLASVAGAHIVREEPWHPIPYAYRTAVFLLNLQPADWDLIERKFTADDEVVGAPAAERIRELDQAAGTAHWPAIEQALADQDAQALYAAGTRAVSHAIRHRLEQAAARLDRPGEARRELTEAERLYRAFADFIQQTDAEAYRELGIAWLDLSSRIATASVVAVAGRAGADPTFEAARAKIESYLRANYEPDEFASRRSFAPVPELRFHAEPELRTTPWLPPGSDLNDQDPLPRLVLNFEEQGIDERDLFLVAFGDMLFDTPEIFGEPARSLGLACSTCHNRSDINQRLFIPGITPRPGVIDVDGAFFNGRFNDHRPDAIDIPSLRGIRFTAPYGRDGRLASLRDFVRNVIVNEFAGEEPSPLVLDALVAYMLEFDFLPAPYLNGDGTLNDQASEAAQRGEALFNEPFAQMAGRACASCHIPDSFFADGRAHNIGSSGESYAGALDGAYDTPTLLGIVHTAPYFHDGSLETLADVVAWFDDNFELELSERQRADLTAYLEAVGAGEEPYERFDAENTPFRLTADELSTFLSTLSTLIPARDRAHADLLLRTVAGDLAADASAMTNRAAIERVREMVTRLEELRAAVAAEQWDEAEALWVAYQDLERQYAMEMY